MIVLYLFLLVSFSRSEEMKFIMGGTYKPLLAKGNSQSVDAFYIDEVPVTNEMFLNFTKHLPQWRRYKVPRLFADSNYLNHWKTSTDKIDKKLYHVPVVNISWFAAKAYCDWKHKRLPTVDEWEYLSQLGPVDNLRDVKSIILEWYSKPNPKELSVVRSTFRNKFGVWDVHGLIWHWNYDFNTAFITGESRGDSALEKSMYCGSGALNAADPSDYASFMRFGFRSSLKGDYAVENLGFRCAKNGEL